MRHPDPEPTQGSPVPGALGGLATCWGSRLGIQGGVSPAGVDVVPAERRPWCPGDRQAEGALCTSLPCHPGFPLTA